MKLKAFLFIPFFFTLNLYCNTIEDFKKIDDNKKASFYRKLTNEDKLNSNLIFLSRINLNTPYSFPTKN